MHGRKRAGGVGLRVMELVMSRIGRMLAMVVAALALTAAPAIAAVPQEAYTRVAFAEGAAAMGTGSRGTPCCIPTRPWRRGGITAGTMR